MYPPYEAPRAVVLSGSIWGQRYLRWDTYFWETLEGSVITSYEIFVGSYEVSLAYRWRRG
jgi:hypothetical protein